MTTSDRRTVPIPPTQAVDADKLNRIHLLLVEDASRGLADVTAGKVKDARSILAALQRRRRLA